MNQLHRRRLIRNSVAALSCACFPGAFAATTSTAGNNCEPLGAPPRRRPQQAISLKALQARVSACKKAEACPKEAQSLYGLTRIDGFVVDRENHDIVLLGAQAQDEPPLHLDDFLVALRNLHGRYPGLGVGEGVLTYPAIFQ